MTPEKLMACDRLLLANVSGALVYSSPSYRGFPSIVPHAQMNTLKPKVASIPDLLYVLALKYSLVMKPTPGPYSKAQHCVDRTNASEPLLAI